MEYRQCCRKEKCTKLDAQGRFSFPFTGSARYLTRKQQTMSPLQVRYGRNGSRWTVRVQVSCTGMYAIHACAVRQYRSVGHVECPVLAWHGHAYTLEKQRAEAYSEGAEGHYSTWTSTKSPSEKSIGGTMVQPFQASACLFLMSSLLPFTFLCTSRTGFWRLSISISCLARTSQIVCVDWYTLVCQSRESGNEGSSLVSTSTRERCTPGLFWSLRLNR